MKKSRRLKAALCLLLLPAACAGVAARQTKPAPRPKPEPRLRVGVRGKSLVLTVGGRAHVLRVADKIEAAKLEGAGIVFVTRRADFTYLVVEACGPSKLKADARQCGLGSECNLLWLKLTPRWQLAEARSALFASCWSSVSNDPMETRGRTLSLEYDDFRRELRVRLTYDAEQPERGFNVQESPLAQQRPPG